MTVRPFSVLATSLLIAPLNLWSVPASARCADVLRTARHYRRSDGPDTLIGQSGVADVIYGGGGNDYILGGDCYEDDAVPGVASDLDIISQARLNIADTGELAGVEVDQRQQSKTVELVQELATGLPDLRETQKACEESTQ